MNVRNKLECLSLAGHSSRVFYVCEQDQELAHFSGALLLGKLVSLGLTYKYSRDKPSSLLTNICKLRM